MVLVVDETKPLLVFEVMEGWQWLLVDKTSPPLVFEVTEGWCWLASPRKEQQNSLLMFSMREGVVVVVGSSSSLPRAKR